MGVSAGADVGEGGVVEAGTGIGTVVPSTTGATVGLGSVAVGSGWTTGTAVAGATVGAAPPPHAAKPIKTTRIAETTAGKAKCLSLIFPSNAESIITLKHPEESSGRLLKINRYGLKTSLCGALYVVKPQLFS